MKIEMTYGILTEKLNATLELIDDCEIYQQAALLKEYAELQSNVDKIMIDYYLQLNTKKQNQITEKLDIIDEATQFIKSLYTTEKVKSKKVSASKDEQVNHFLTKYSKSMTK